MVKRKMCGIIQRPNTPFCILIGQVKNKKQIYFLIFKIKNILQIQSKLKLCKIIVTATLYYFALF